VPLHPCGLVVGLGLWVRTSRLTEKSPEQMMKTQDMNRTARDDSFHTGRLPL